MEERIGRFIAGLRASGVRISIAESEDAWRAIRHMGITDREIYRLTLRATLVKDPTDLEIFDELFPMYFGLDTPPLLNPLAELTPEQLDDLWEQLGEFAGDLEELLNWLLSGDVPTQEELEELGDMAGLDMANAPYQAEWYARRMQRLLGWQRLPEVLEFLMERLAEMGFSPQEIQAIREQIDENQDAVGEALANYSGRRIMDQMADEQRERKENTHQLMNRSFDSLNENEMQTIRDQIRRLAARLRSRIALRQKRAKAGKLDARTTIRNNLRYGGVPLELKYKTKRLKPKIVVMVDLSGSMRPVAGFMLHLLYELQDQVSKSRSFAFINSCVDVTDEFKYHRPSQAIDAILNKIPRGYYNTDLGRALREYTRDHLNTLDNRTTFIVLGDGRNNYNDPALDAFQEIKTRARRVVWLNPEFPAQWGTGDSDMPKYLPLCDEVHQVRNMSQLASAIDKMMSF